MKNYAQIANQVPTEKAFALVDLGRARKEKTETRSPVIGSCRRNPHYAAAFLRLGVALRRNRKFTEAESALNEASKLFDLSNEVEGTTEVLLQKGLALSQQGKSAEAQAQLQQALERAVALEHHEQQIRTLQELSNTCILAGDAGKARGTQPGDTTGACKWHGG